MRKYFPLGFLGLILCIGSIPKALSEDLSQWNFAEINRPDSKKQITGLTWKTDPYPLGFESRSARSVTLEGTYVRPGWHLFLNKIAVQTSSKGEFRIKIPITAKETPIDLFASSPKGEVEKELIKLVATNKQKESGSTTTQLGTSLSYMSHSYRETRKPDFSETAIAFKASYLFFIMPPKWFIDTNFYVTALPLTTNRTGIAARFFGINLRLGRSLSLLPEPWNLSISVGASYATMFVTQNAFGFGHLIQPQLYPTLRYTLKKSGDSALFYVKFVPLNEGFVPKFSERELAYGGGWRNRLKGGNQVTLGFDISDLTFNPKSDYTIRSQLFGLSLGYTF